MIPHFDHEPHGNRTRASIDGSEPIATRTYTPTQAVIAKSAGVFHWTTDGRRLFDFTSGVLVANLGHNPVAWTRRVMSYLGWQSLPSHGEYFEATPLTAYNAVTPIEAEATRRLIDVCRRQPGGGRLERVLWAASGSEAIHKAISTALHFDANRPIIVATRHGFHGKKGLAYAVTGNEGDPERDPRVRFVAFPMEECRDLSLRDRPFDVAPYRAEWERLWAETGGRIGTVVTEPYLGGGGSYHPPAAYLQALQAFCREHGITFILDEVQANFGRCGELFAYSAYGLEPDMVVLGKGLGNGVPVAAVVGRAELFAKLNYGDASDTWSANPLSCAAVAATLDEFESRDVLGPMRAVSETIERGLIGLKVFPHVNSVRGERGGMVWGVEFATRDVANRFVKSCYLGHGGDGVHLLGPLAGTVVRISPPLTITHDEANVAIDIMRQAVRTMAEEQPH
jgi:4-aminobutyrate aminotransferase-like enzyme